MSLLHYISEAFIEDKEKLEQDFLTFLKKQGYPEESIFRGPSFHLKERKKAHSESRKAIVSASREPTPCYADLAVLDLESCQYVCLIEFRLQLDEEIEMRLARLFQDIFDCAHIKPPVFLVIPGANGGFRIHQLREDGNWQELPQSQFPRYQTLTAGLLAENSLSLKAQQTRELDRFTITCYVLAGAIGLITVANIAGFSALSAVQLTLVVVIALLVVAPHAIGFRISASEIKSRFFKSH